MKNAAFIPLALLMCLVGTTTGCQDGQNGWGGSRRGQDPPAESNIIRVFKFVSSNPWLIFKNDGSGRVDGVRITVYLEGPGKAKGVFGTGTLLVAMYRLDRDALGQEITRPIHEWELPPEKAYPWRAKKETALGWAYSLRLQWPASLDLAGRDVAILVKYVRDDGRVIGSSRQTLRVPAIGAS